MTSDAPPKAVVISTETARLLRYLGIRGTIDRALAEGYVSRTKIAESWLYHPSDLDGGGLVTAALAAADHALGEWLVVPLPVLSGMVSSIAEPSCSKKAALALLHHLIASRQLDRLGLLTARNEPFLAVFRPIDAVDVAELLAVVRDHLRESGIVRALDLPAPERHRSARRAWADAILGHAEFQGWGHIRAGALRAWPEVGAR